jgi:flagella basal body P-ring formation protein FlgA
MAKFSTSQRLGRGAVAVAAIVLGAGVALADTQELPTPKLVIYPGEVIAEQALVNRAFNANMSAKMPPVYRKASDVVGKIARRTLVPGQPIALNATRIPDVVTQGKTYRIEYREAGLVIAGTAVAVTSGAVGDVVSLRNPDSGLIVRGIVRGDGTVRMGVN